MEDRRRNARNKLHELVIRITNSETMKLLSQDEREEYLGKLEPYKTWTDKTENEYIDAAINLNKRFEFIKVNCFIKSCKHIV